MPPTETDTTIDPFLHFPPFLFLAGDSPVRHHLAFLLTEEDMGMLGVSLKTPLRDGIRGTFYGGDPSLSLSDEALENTPLLSINLKASKFIDKYHDFLVHTFGTNVFGEILETRMREDSVFFDRFVIEDADIDLLESVNHICQTFGPDKCLILNLLLEGGGQTNQIEIPLVRSLKLFVPSNLSDTLLLETTINLLKE